MQSVRQILGLCVLAMLVGLATQPASADEIIIGGQCDRTGPTKNVGTQLCPGVFDYVKLVAKQGGIKGHTLRYIEVENAYKVDRGVEAYERLKHEGAVIMLDYGTPIVYALTPRHLEDKIPGLTPGFGRADSTDGKRFPYIFPMAASYWSQMGAAMQHIKATGGGKKGSKVAYLFYDNPAGREPLGIFNRVCTQEGYECREFAVPPPGVEMSSQVLDITRRMRPDWVVTNLFGKAPSISIKEFKKNAFPLDKVISLVWGAGEEDMQVAGWDTAEGYLGMQFAGVGRDFPVIQDIIKMYQDDKQEVPDYIGNVYYNRGVLAGALIAEGARQAIEHGGLPVTGVTMQQGFERLKDFTLGGFLPPLTVHPEDHEGGGWVRLYQTRGGKLVPFTDWFQGYRDIVLDEVKKAGEAEEKK